MSNLLARLDRIEARADDDGALAREGSAQVRAVVVDGVPADGLTVQNFKARVRTANDRKPSTYLAHMLKWVEVVLEA